MCIVACSTFQKLLIELIMVNWKFRQKNGNAVKIFRLITDSYVRQSAKISWDDI